MSKGTLKGLGLVIIALLVAALILTFTNIAQAEEKHAPNCTSAITDNTLVTQCNDGTVTVVNQATNTVLVCNSAKSTDGTPRCVTQNLARPN